MYIYIYIYTHVYVYIYIYIYIYILLLLVAPLVLGELLPTPASCYTIVYDSIL